MTRTILGVVVGFVAWFVAATIGNFLIRAAIPEYAPVEATMSFTLPMLLARLALGAVSSVLAGLACALVARGRPNAAKILAIVLVLFFIPVHYGLWAKFPVWYHAFFLLTLAPLALLGGRLAQRNQGTIVPLTGGNP